jgi:hypothetical protein
MNRATRRLATPHLGRKTAEQPRIAGIGRGLNAHEVVAKVAVEMANEVFDHYMAANNALYRAFKRDLTAEQARIAFVAKVAPTMLEQARIALTDCLSQPDDVLPRAGKDKIAEALILDGDLRANRAKAPEHMPSGLIH